MKRSNSIFWSALTAAAALAWTGNVAAQSTWNLYEGASNNREGVISGCAQATGTGSNNGNFNNSWNCSVGAAGTGQQKLTASSWSTDRAENAGTYTSFHLSGSGFASAYMSAQGTSGFGSSSRTEAQTARRAGDTTPLNPGSPGHSFDSIAPGTSDVLLLDFGAAQVILDKIGIGWTNGDADLTVMRWTGTTAPTRTTGTTGQGGNENLTNSLYNPNTPATAGWQLVGSYSNLGTDNTTPFGGSARSTGATQASSWWLISSFNTTLNGGSTSCKKADGTHTTCGDGNDSFKFNFIQTTLFQPPPGTSTGVSEPGSLALAGLALLGVFAARRRPLASR